MTTYLFLRAASKADSLDPYPPLLTDEGEALESIIANQTLRASPTLVLVLVANAHPPR